MTTSLVQTGLQFPSGNIQQSKTTGWSETPIFHGYYYSDEFQTYTLYNNAFTKLPLVGASFNGPSDQLNAGNYRFVCIKNGYYKILTKAYIRAPSNQINYLIFETRLNGIKIDEWGRWDPYSAPYYGSEFILCRESASYMAITAGDYVETYVYVSGTNNNLFCSFIEFNANFIRGL